MTVNGEEHTVESEFAWGLVSLNTDKSTYHPGENALFVIVALDSEGHPVSGADVSMNITTPTGQITGISTDSGVTAGSEIGLYEANYLTSEE